jgi:hypothetical protein
MLNNFVVENFILLILAARQLKMTYKFTELFNNIMHSMVKESDQDVLRAIDK